MQTVPDGAGIAGRTGPLAIICGGGSLPFAVADAVAARGRPVVLFALRGSADPERSRAIRITGSRSAKFGGFARLARAEGCRDVVLIGTLVRPSICAGALRLATLRLLPRIVARLSRRRQSSAVGRRAHVRGRHGLPRASAPTRSRPRSWCRKARSAAARPPQRDRADIARGLATARARSGRSTSARPWSSPTSTCWRSRRPKAPTACSTRVAELRASGRIARRAGVGVLVKAPKPGQDRRFDLPSIGPQHRRGRGARRARRHRGRGRRNDRRRAGATRRGRRPRRIVRHRRAADGQRPMSGRAPATARRRAMRYVFLVAGEESGDRLGARLDARARGAHAGAARSLRGVGGRAHGGARACASLFPIDDWRSSALPPSRAVCRSSCGASARPPTPVIAARPDVLVIIDSPDFTHRVARRVRARHAGHPDRRLCLALGLGLAALARARHAPLCRSRAGAAAVRARRRMRGSAARPAAYVGHPLDRGARPAAPERRGSGAPRWPIRRSCWCCREAAPARSAAWRRSSARAVALRGRAGGPLELVLPTRAASRRARARGDRRLGRCGRASSSTGRREACGVPHRAGGARASAPSTLELALAGVPMVAAYTRHACIEDADRPAVDPGRHRDPRQSGARRERRAGIPAGRRARRNSLPRRLLPLLARHAGAAAPDRGFRAARRHHGDRRAAPERARRRCRAGGCAAASGL